MYREFRPWLHATVKKNRINLSTLRVNLLSVGLFPTEVHGELSTRPYIQFCTKTTFIKNKNCLFLILDQGRGGGGDGPSCLYTDKVD